MTEAVAYAFHCLGQEGLHTSLKPLIYLYTILVWSGCLHKQQLVGSTKTCHNLYGTKPDHTTIIEVYKGLALLASY